MSPSFSDLQQKRPLPEDTPISSTLFPLGDDNTWYYPSHGHDADQDENLYSEDGNWGNKVLKRSRFIRRGKIAPWGPAMEDWETEEHARKRIKLLIPPDRRSPSPPILPNLHSPSPPLTSPYHPPNSHHLSYSSFVMDKAVTHTFRSGLLDELEYATNGLIEGETTMKRALGRLWQVLSEDPDKRTSPPALVPKLEDDEDDDTDEQDPREKRLARAPDLTPLTYKYLLSSYPNTTSSSSAPASALPAPGSSAFEPPPLPIVSPEIQLENLEKSLATMRELQDDGREYMERLLEIREGLGEVRVQRNGVWEIVRAKAIKELQDAAFNSTTNV